jgi:hypothetical protein
VPDNKSHHYVPRFYLRNFSRSGKSIDLFNIGSKRLIRDAPIKGQCCRDYFYGKNLDSEKSLSAAEGEVAQLFRLINQQVRLPRYFTAGHLLLCFHIATQARRTQYAAEVLDDMTDGMMREVMKHHHKVTPDMLAQVRFGYDDPALVSIAQATLSFPLLMDLECRALLAPRGTEFITSDNPVVMYNQFMSWRRVGSNTGLASKGLQVFFPIWPFLTLVMYDRDVYHFGRDKSAPIHMASPMDVHDLNVLQVAATSENLYMFSPAANIFKVTEDAAKFRREKKAVVRAFPQPNEGSRESELVAISYEDIRTNATLGFMRIHKHARAWLENFRSQRLQQAAIVRNPELVARFETHVQAVKDGKATSEEVITNMFGKPIADGTF